MTNIHQILPNSSFVIPRIYSAEKKKSLALESTYIMAYFVIRGFTVTRLFCGRSEVPNFRENNVDVL